jgi:DNA-binding MarR family transcriptional regulator
MDLNWDSKMGDSVRAARLLLITGGEGVDRHSARIAAEASGHRIAQEVSIDQADDWFERALAADALLLELGEGYDFDEARFGRIEAYAADQGIPLLVNGRLEDVDGYTSALCGPTVTWLADPTMADRVASLALAVQPRSAHLHDVSSDMDPQRLRRLADEVSRIARALSNLSDSDRPDQGYAAAALSDVQLGFKAEPELFDADVPMPTPEEIRKILRLRRLRDRFFDPSLFADPAWDMLLDLMAARLERAQVAVSSLCIAASVPPTTALRWIKAMTDHALFERCADPDDGRRIFIRLSDKAMQGLARYFDAARKLGGLAI